MNIVERLRDGNLVIDYKTAQEAADEIERLQEALNLIAKTTYGYDPMTMSDEERGDYFANRFFDAQNIARIALKVTK